jgi:hypothetical protein
MKRLLQIQFNSSKQRKIAILGASIACGAIAPYSHDAFFFFEKYRNEHDSAGNSIPDKNPLSFDGTLPYQVFK